MNAVEVLILVLAMKRSLPVTIKQINVIITRDKFGSRTVCGKCPEGSKQASGFKLPRCYSL